MGARTTSPAATAGRPKPDAYAWTALANTTAAMFMATVDGSIVIIALPAIFRGINLDTTRHWTEDDMAALERVQAEVTSILAPGN